MERRQSPTPALALSSLSLQPSSPCTFTFDMSNTHPSVSCESSSRLPSSPLAMFTHMAAQPQDATINPACSPAVPTIDMLSSCLSEHSVRPPACSYTNTTSLECVAHVMTLCRSMPQLCKVIKGRSFLAPHFSSCPVHVFFMIITCHLFCVFKSSFP